MDMSVITPSFNMLTYLKRCHASVADQVGPTHEHIVVDAESGDGSQEWLRANQRIVSIIERDNGMYDAINKGLKIARGAIVSYLNCDEQYLPQTLAFAGNYLANHPTVDVMFGDTLLIRPDGSLISVQKTYKPAWPWMVGANLYLYTSSMFIRRRVIDDGQLFDPGYRGTGDHEFIVRLLRAGYQVRSVRHFLSAFTLTGSNHSQTAHRELREDRLRMARVTPWWAKPLKVPLRLSRIVVKASSGAYVQWSPVVYQVYVAPDATERRTFGVARASALWPGAKVSL
jgi:glycosyltransferase involved in cell wall biosynthesis